jgi:hypothetical protein
MKAIKIHFITLYALLVVIFWPLAAVSSEPPGCTIGPTIPGEVRDYFLVWKILPAEIIQNGSETIAVKGKLAPFRWEVRGDGFELENEDGIVNTLKADENACGVAEITVTDEIGNSIIGYVRCKSGGWGNRTEGCIFSGGAPQISLNFEESVPVAGKYRRIQKVDGKYRQTQIYWGPTSLQWGQCPQEGCDNFCGAAAECHPEYGCNPCLLSETVLPCFNDGYANTDCPPSCRRWCYCTTEYYYEEWMCNPE